MKASLEYFRSLLKNKESRFIKNYINLECQSRQFDILIEKLHNITESKDFYNLDNKDGLSIINETKNLVSEQNKIKNRLSRLKGKIKPPKFPYE